MLDTLPDRFWSKVHKTAECWHWTGARNHLGYGQIYRREWGRARRSTAVAWFFAYGHWPERHEHLCHRCDTPSCVRPDHLFIGDAKANIRDCIAKGRFRFPEASYGVRNNLAKMTMPKVREARRRFKDGETVSALSRRFRLARSTMREIVYGRNWREPGVATIPRGRPTRKLSQDDVVNIRRLFSLGHANKSQLARQFTVDPATIKRHLAGQ